ncbi:MAG: hypothetical protein KF788_05935 [Piscinibacter sp.]|nr:hypothetical protein [Piscinibacter sp.]
MTRTPWPLTLLLLLPTAGGAAPADPLAAPACTRAMAALEALEAQLPASSPASRAPLARHARLRRDAARACLGTRTDTAVPVRRAQPPVSVAPVRVPASTPGTAAPTLPERPAVAPPRLPGPLTVTGCDAGGCWTSDGAYLPRAGAQLFSPRGLCDVRGTTVHCP